MYHMKRNKKCYKKILFAAGLRYCMLFGKMKEKLLNLNVQKRRKGESDVFRNYCRA